MAQLVCIHHGCIWKPALERFLRHRSGIGYWKARLCKQHRFALGMYAPQ